MYSLAEDCGTKKCISNPFFLPHQTKNQTFRSGLFGGGGRIRTIEAIRSRFTVCKKKAVCNGFLDVDIKYDSFDITGARGNDVKAGAEAAGGRLIRQDTCACLR